MLAQRLLMVFLAVSLLLSACTKTEDKQQETTFKQLPELQEIEPQKPMKIKLKRNTDGEYSWDISGDNAEEIIKIDKSLREGLKIK